MIRRAIVLASSKGRRLNGQDVPAPLTKVGGVPLIKRTLQALEQQGIQDMVIVVGYRGEEIRRSVSSDPDISSSIIWVDNPDWHTPVVSSLVRARPHVDGPTMVLSTELVFASDMLAPLLDRELFHYDATLLVDRKLSRVYDLGSALKVRTLGSRAVKVAQQLDTFDAVAVGIAVVRPELLDELEEP